MMLLGQPPGHDADHARVPVAVGQHQRRRAVAGRTSSASCLLAALRTLRSSVCRWSFSSSMYSASCIARCGESVVNSSTASCGLPEPAGRVQPRARS